MSAIAGLLKEVIPLGVLVLTIVFLYLLLAFKRLADKVILLEKRSGEIAADQSQYMSDRIGAIDKHTSSLERVATSQARELDRVYAERDKLLVELERSRDGSLVALEDQFSDVMNQLRALGPIGQQTSRIEEQMNSLRQEVEVVKGATQARYNKMTRMLIDRSGEGGPEEGRFRFYWLQASQQNVKATWWPSVLRATLADAEVEVMDSPLRSDPAAFSRSADVMHYCDVVIADLTKPTPFVFYELGRAQAELKPTIIITDSAERVPFNLANIKIFLVHRGKPQEQEFEEGLSQVLSSLIGDLANRSPQKSTIDRLQDFVRLSRYLWFTPNKGEKHQFLQAFTAGERVSYEEAPESEEAQMKEDIPKKEQIEE